MRTPSSTHASYRIYLAEAHAVELALAGIALVTLGALVWLLWPREVATAELATPAALTAPALAVAAPNATLLAAPPTPLPTPTLDGPTLAAQHYQQGLVAYEAQDWPLAGELLQKVYDYRPDYLNIGEVLAATYYNWGAELLGRQAPVEALAKFGAALTVDPQHQLARDQQQRLALYTAARDLREQGAQRDAAMKLEELRALDGAFLDSAALLYELYIVYGGQLEQAGGAEDARRVYAKAAELPVEDTSAAQAALSRLRPPATPTPKPAARKLRFRVANYNDDPRCISVRITGIAPAGWYFVVDGLGLQGRFDGGGNARTCGLGPGQEVTLTVIDGAGTRVAGGGGVPAKGSAIMVAEWR